MISRVHSKLGTAGLVVAIVALVVALTGVAFAATGLNSKQKKEVKKIAKQFAGVNGAPGAVGPQGPKGDAGPKGDTGLQGKQGLQGPPGDPWTAGGVLPSEETETGAWAFGNTAGTGVQNVPVSFNIPLTEAPEVHFIQVNGFEKVSDGEGGFNDVAQPDCPGDVEEPTAEPGVLCLYAKTEALLLFGGYPPNTATFTTGAVVGFLPSGVGANGYGTWAVTAE